MEIPLLGVLKGGGGGLMKTSNKKGGGGELRVSNGNLNCTNVIGEI